MKQVIICLIIGLTFNLVNAQDIKYNFEDVKHLVLKSDDSNKNEYISNNLGIDGSAGYTLESTKDILNLISVMEDKKNYTLKFWFKITDEEEDFKNILASVDNEKMKIDFIIQPKGMFYKQTNPKQSNLFLPFDIKKDEWYQITFLSRFIDSENFMMSIYLNNVRGMETSFNKTGWVEVFTNANAINIGGNNEDYFDGVIDNIIYKSSSKRKDKENITSNNFTEEQNSSSQTDEEKKDEEKTIETNNINTVKDNNIGKEKEKTSKTNLNTEANKTKITLPTIANFDNRQNEIQDSIVVGQREIIVYLWDDDYVDNDVVSISCFHKVGGTYNPYKNINDIKLQKKRKKTKKIIELIPNTENYLRFDAIEMGEVERFNTVTLQFKINRVLSREYQMRPDSLKSAVFKIFYDKTVDNFSEFEEKETAEETITENNSKSINIDPIYVESREVKISAIGDDCIIVLKGNGETKPLRVEPDKYNETYFLLPNNDVSMIKVLMNQNHPDKKKVTIRVESEGIEKPLNPSKLELSREQIYRLFIEVDAPERQSNVKEITVKNRNLILKIWDGVEEDGDVVTILQDEKTILENYKLTKNQREEKVVIPYKGETKLIFIPIEEGIKKSNTTSIIVSDGVKNKKINLASKNLNEPAFLIIKYQPND